MRTNSAHGSAWSGVCSRSPKGTVRWTGPTLKLASPWNFGPSTWMLAPIEIEIVTEPIQTSIVTPAEIEAYTSTSSENGSK